MEFHPPAVSKPASDMKPSDHPEPPKWPLKCLRFFVKEEYLEEIEGDMEELFYDNSEQLSLKQARRTYTWEMLKLLRPAIMKGPKGIQHLSLNQNTMFRNYAKTSLRSLLKNPMSAFINIFGLSVAIGICILVYAFLEYDKSIDQFHKNKQSVYLVTFFADRDGSVKQYGQTPRPMGEMLKADFAQIKKTCRLEDRNVVVKHGDNVFHEKVRYSDPEFLEMFTFPLKWGLSSSLTDMNSIVLSEEMSIKYFGDENPLGQNILVKFDETRSKVFKITGVAATFPKARAIDFGFLINFNNSRISDPNYDSHDWNAFVNATLIQVDNPADMKGIEQGMVKYKKLQNEVQEDWKIASFALEPLAGLYKKSGEISNDISINPPFEAIIAFPIIAVFMLALACFNYINIAIVSATKRLKEIGVRKVIGANRARVIVQFLAENLLVTFFALILGLVLAATFFIPGFTRMTHRQVDLILISGNLWIFLVSILLLTGLVSGMYPAFYISRFDPIQIFKGSVRFGKKNPLTKIFLGLQLIMACILITGAVMFAQNTDYQASRSWGYNQKGALYVRVPDQSAFDQLHAAMAQDPNVLSQSGSSHHLGRDIATTVVHRPPNLQYEVHELAVDANYFETMGLQLKEGRVFNAPHESDKQAVVVNELLVKNMALGQKPIGQLFKIDSTRYEVVGVVKDFHAYSFYFAVLPTIFKVAAPADYRFLSMRVRAGSEKETYQALKGKWAKLFPEIPFQGGYQEDVWDHYFKSVEVQATFSKTVALIAVLLASLGLYGLVSLNVSGRVREFSIRKVLGAGLNNIASNIAREYVILSAVALIIAAPISYILVEGLFKILYAYPLPITYAVIAIVIATLLLVLLTTVSILVSKVLRSNPVIGLKVE
jgi:putative ABC transport system permease protein